MFIPQLSKGQIYSFLNYRRNEDKPKYLFLNYQRNEAKAKYLLLNYRRNEDEAKYLLLNYRRNKDEAKYLFPNYRRNEDKAKYSFFNYLMNKDEAKYIRSSTIDDLPLLVLIYRTVWAHDCIAKNLLDIYELVKKYIKALNVLSKSYLMTTLGPI
jgi:hypothetical protein